VTDEILKRNVARLVKAPKVTESPMQILSAAEFEELLPRLAGDPYAGVLYPVVALAVASGLRRGEILGLAWRHFDAAKGLITVERKLGETRARTLFLEAPKTEAGYRRVTIPPVIVEILVQRRRTLNQARLAIGIGGVAPDDLIFADVEGRWPSPDNISRDWVRLRRRLGLPQIRFHGLRHTHVSVLVRAGFDVVQISRRVGHANAGFTLRQYSHLFNPDDAGAAAAIAAALGGSSAKPA
jgi:integrase